MKFVCYKEFDDPQEPVMPGIFRSGKILPLARAVAVAEALAPKGVSVPQDLNAVMARMGSYVGVVRDLEKARVLDKLWLEAGVNQMAPLPSPHRILAIGRNYSEHAKELGSEVPDEPIVFQKASTSVIASGAPIVLPHEVGRVDFEGELAVVIGTGGRSIAEAEALSHVAGYTLINDVTARDVQKRAIGKSLPWFLSKSYDTFGPLGPCIVTPDEIANPQNLLLTLSVNGEVKQETNTSEMLFSIPALIAYLSQHLALHPGDVIATGTPARRRPNSSRRLGGSPHPGDRHIRESRDRRRRSVLSSPRVRNPWLSAVGGEILDKLVLDCSRRASVAGEIVHQKRENVQLAAAARHIAGQRTGLTECAGFGMDIVLSRRPDHTVFERAVHARNRQGSVVERPVFLAVHPQEKLTDRSRRDEVAPPHPAAIHQSDCAGVHAKTGKERRLAPMPGVVSSGAVQLSY